MCSLEWDAVAHFYLQTGNICEDSEEIYCLCSRVFTWLNDYSKNISDSDGDYAKQNTDEAFSHLEYADVKNCIDVEPVSCYCSASHTDNISTDEHDSLNESHSATHPVTTKVLHLSDSGTDLSDHVKRNINAWQIYWSIHGERLIWESWISKYSDYIDPDYIQGNSEQQKQSVKDFSVNDVVRENNRMLIRNLSLTDSCEQLHQEGEGWNRLSPLSNECETEAERLLSSRCLSQTGSLVPTIDSMTNVTQLTVSSVDLSESSKNSEGLSSVSSIQSSITSSSSVDGEEVLNSQHWNILWSDHYEEMYLQQYNKFFSGDLEEEKIIENTEEICLDVLESLEDAQTKSALLNENSNTLNLPSNISKGSYKKRKPMLQDLNTISIEEVNSSQANESDNLQANLGELKQMELLGLPLMFSASRQNCSLKRSGIQKIDQSSSKRIKSVFNLIGISMEEDSDNQLTGYVECHTQHVRSQNRFIKLYKKKNLELTSKHTYFDDNGDAIEEKKESGNESTSNDLLALLASSADEDIKVPILIETQTTSKQKKKRKKKTLPTELKGNSKLLKYWHKRYSLFSKFDEGIKLDTESWFSVSPEQIALHTAERCRCDVIIDAFCGAGGNTIQFAMTCTKVIAIDIDPKKIELAKHNAQIYQVDDRIEFIVGDFFELANSLKADVVFLSPPWGGPEYLNLSTYDLELLQPAPFSKLMETAKKVTDNIGLFLPRNANTHPLIMAAGLGGCVEIEQNFLGKKLVAITAYYGELVKDTKIISACNHSV